MPRISADQDDPDFVGPRRYIVFLNDEPVSACVVANDELGYVVFFRRRPCGCLAQDGEGDLIRDVRRGKVRIELIEARGVWT